MEIGNRADAYTSAYYPSADANNRQTVSEVEKARAQQERERERTAAANKPENNEENQLVVDSSRTTYQADYSEAQYEQHRFYTQHADLDRSTRQALETYQRVAHQDDHSLEMLHRVDVLV